MKKSFYSLVLAIVFSFGSLCAKGAEVTSQAVVLKIKGTATAVFTDQNQVSIKVGDKLPQGATIVTTSDSEVDIQAFNGAVATIKADSTVNLEKLSVTTLEGAVTKQTARLDLKVGSIISSIDPANHNINDYSIRTPKGVAAARGTIYTVTVTNTGTVQVFVTQSQIVFINSITNQQTTVPAGSKVVMSAEGVLTFTPLTPAEVEQYKEVAKTDGTVKIIADPTASTNNVDPNTINPSPMN